MISVLNRWFSAQRRYMRRSISAQSVASVPPAPALIDRIAERSSCSPEKSRAVRSRPKSFSSAEAFFSSSASSSASGLSASSSSATSRSSARESTSRQVSSSERSPSASRSTFWAPRWSSQNPGSWVSASSWPTRSDLASRSKTPRGRPDPFGQVADGGRVHLVPDLEILEQQRPQLDEPQGRLAPRDDGVHAGTVAVVRAHAAVSVAIQRRSVAARATVALACDEIDERGILGLLHGLSLSFNTLGHERCGLGATCLGATCVGARVASGRQVLAQYTRPTFQRQEGTLRRAAPRDVR